MKFLKPSGFVDTIEYTSELVLKVIGYRKPAAYRLSGSQITEPRIRLIQRKFK
jgi:hypothetical protein